jgi:hypothetical protein
MAIRYWTLTQDDVDCARGGKGKGEATAAIMDANKETVPATHPVTMVMGSTKEPAAYLPMNASSILERSNQSISDNSVCTVAVSIKPVLDGEGELLTATDPPLSLPHF